MTPSNYSLKSIKKEFHDKGIYYTPPQLGEFIKTLTGDGIREVYDPTCGRGNLLSVFADEVRKYGQEIDEAAARDAGAQLTNVDIRVGNTLYNDTFPEKQFPLIVANPPFSIAYDPTWISPEDPRYRELPVLPPKSKADYLFLAHILHKLTDTGVAYVVCFPGICYRGQREGQIRRWMIQHNYIDEVRLLPAKQFTDTSISTVLLTIRKDRGNKETIYMADIEQKIDRDVPIGEISDNDYSLSTQSYIQPPEPPKAEIDPEQLQEDVVVAEAAHLRTALEFMQFTCGLEDYDFSAILDRMQAVIDEFR